MTAQQPPVVNEKGVIRIPGMFRQDKAAPKGRRRQEDKPPFSPFPFALVLFISVDVAVVWSVKCIPLGLFKVYWDFNPLQPRYQALSSFFLSERKSKRANGPSYGLPWGGSLNCNTAQGPRGGDGYDGRKLAKMPA